METKEEIEELKEEKDSCSCDNVKENIEKDNCKCQNKNENCSCDDSCDCGCKEKSDDLKKQHHNVKKDHHKEHEKKLKEELKKLEEENKSLVEKIKISQAELVNYRKRKDEETANRLKYANQDLVTELIPIVDNFERAIKLEDDELTDEVSKFLTGFKMMYATLTDVLKKFGVEEINRVGEEFDPNLEQALMTDSNPDMKDDIVTEVLLKGYKLKDRVIRPASVKINKLN